MDINYYRRVAGLSLLTESDDDDLSPAERELARKADADLKKKGVDVDKELSAAEERAKKAKAKKAAAAKAAPAPAAAKEEPKAEEKKEEPKAEEKKDAPAAATPSAAKKMHQAVEWLKNNKGATRKEFMTAAEKWGMSRAYAGAYFYPLRKRAAGGDLKEAFILLHPSVERFALTENRMFGRYQWMSLEDAETFLEPLVFETKAAAEKVLKHLRDVKSMDAVVETLKVDL
jgi:chemotaxis protein histidine kinase CheA